MGCFGAVGGEATAGGSRQRPATETGLPGRDQRDAVRTKDGLPVADAAQGFPAMEDGVGLPATLATGGDLGQSPARFARSRPTEGRTPCRTLGCHHRFALNQECWKRGQRGFDAGKKIKGRKQPIAVDTMGFLLAVIVYSAGIQDRWSTKPARHPPLPALPVKAAASRPYEKLFFSVVGCASRHNLHNAGLTRRPFFREPCASYQKLMVAQTRALSARAGLAPSG